MKSKEVLIALIDHLSQFERSHNGESISLIDFLAYLNSQLLPEQSFERQIGGNAAPPIVRDMSEETHSVIGRLVVIMHRYAKGYMKKALEGSAIQTGEEFSFLIILLTFESLTKTELIHKNVIEIPSGVEIIKRLLRHGLLKEFDDPSNKRNKRVAITEKGRLELLNILPKMHQVTSIIAGNLTNTERASLAYLLKKLDHYHHQIFTNDRTSDFEDLIRKYLLREKTPKLSTNDDGLSNVF